MTFVLAFHICTTLRWLSLDDSHLLSNNTLKSVLRAVSSISRHSVSLPTTAAVVLVLCRSALCAGGLHWTELVRFFAGCFVRSCRSRFASRLATPEEVHRTQPGHLGIDAVVKVAPIRSVFGCAVEVLLRCCRESSSLLCRSGNETFGWVREER